MRRKKEDGKEGEGKDEEGRRRQVRVGRRGKRSGVEEGEEREVFLSVQALR